PLLAPSAPGRSGHGYAELRFSQSPLSAQPLGTTRPRPAPTMRAVRPTHLSLLVIAILLEIGVAITAIGFWIGSHGGKPWHYWFAPILALQVAVAITLFAIAYWRNVGRLEMRGRPRSG